MSNSIKIRSSVAVPGTFLLEVNGVTMQDVVSYVVDSGNPGATPQVTIKLLVDELDAEIDAEVAE